MPTTSVSPLPITLVERIEIRQTLLGLSNQEICTALGFEREIALGLIKAGTIKMPLAKVPALAAVLQIDAVELLKVALRESDLVLAKLIEEAFNPMHLSTTEVAQIKHQRSLSGSAVGAPITLQVEDVIALVEV